MRIKCIVGLKIKAEGKFDSDMAKQSLDKTSMIDEGNLRRRLLTFGRNKIAAHHGKVGYTV